jgi:hypothetical protein
VQLLRQPSGEFLLGQDVTVLFQELGATSALSNMMNLSVYATQHSTWRRGKAAIPLLLLLLLLLLPRQQQRGTHHVRPLPPPAHAGAAAAYPLVPQAARPAEMPL